MTSPIQPPLRASALVFGQLYYSPAGRLCMLMRPAGNCMLPTSYLFAYLTPTGKFTRDERFSINAENAQAIAAMRPADDGAPPLLITRLMKARGMA